jgi:site-specific recombinase XerD
VRARGAGSTSGGTRLSYGAAKAVDRYLRARARHPQAWRPQLWLGAGSRGPLTASGVYQAVIRRGLQCGVEVWPHRFRHHFSHTWLDRGGPEGDLIREGCDQGRIDAALSSLSGVRRSCRLGRSA